MYVIYICISVYVCMYGISMLSYILPLSSFSFSFFSRCAQAHTYIVALLLLLFAYFKGHINICMHAPNTRNPVTPSRQLADHFVGDWFHFYCTASQCRFKCHTLGGWLIVVISRHATRYAWHSVTIVVQA